ncbi:DUF262 domain-containing protein [Neisseria flavescens]|uniref:DUF262 domain-containing protein n=1 Tax=Neisseria flavescens TaxID=484 RepID=UPI0018D32CE1
MGSLVIYKRENGDLEVIDGQQRLTTLTLIMHYLKSDTFVRNVYFEHRNDSDYALGHLDSDSIPDVFKNALKSIKNIGKLREQKKKEWVWQSSYKKTLKLLEPKYPKTPTSIITLKL